MFPSKKKWKKKKKELKQNKINKRNLVWVIYTRNNKIKEKVSPVGIDG
jgi:hypothetical protein